MEKKENKMPDTTDPIYAMLQRIRSRYDAEFDLIPNGPRVTWAEEDLADAVERLLHRVEELEAQVARLQEGGPYGTK